MKEFEEPKMELLYLEEIVTFDDIKSEDDETRVGGGGYGPILG